MQPTITLSLWRPCHSNEAIESVFHLIDDTSLQATAIWFKDNGYNAASTIYFVLSKRRFILREATASDYLLYDRPRKRMHICGFFSADAI